MSIARSKYSPRNILLTNYCNLSQGYGYLGFVHTIDVTRKSELFRHDIVYLINTQVETYMRSIIYEFICLPCAKIEITLNLKYSYKRLGLFDNFFFHYVISIKFSYTYVHCSTHLLAWFTVEFCYLLDSICEHLII